MDTHGEMLIYQTEDGLTKIDVNIQDEIVWLSLEQMSDLFQRDKSTISRHIKNIFDEGKLVRISTVAKFATVQNERNRQVERTIEYYNLDVIISVGYCVKSQRGVQFRIWATNILKEYIKKGFAMDDDRLKELGGGGDLSSCRCRKGLFGKHQNAGAKRETAEIGYSKISNNSSQFKIRWRNI